MLPITVPPLGESITEATVSRWLRREGETVSAGETLVELETDKITVEVPALKAGVLAKRAKSEGDIVRVNDVLGELDESAVPGDGREVRSAPSARRLAEESGVDLARVQGTGRGGVVSKPDVVAASAAPAARPARAPAPAAVASSAAAVPLRAVASS